MQITLDELVKAIDDTDAQKRYYYYIPEERIILKDDEVPESELIALPSHKEINDYGTMLDFIEDKTDGEAKEWLEECVKGAGAFRRFRSTLERFGLSEDWYEYLEAAHEDIAIEWCEYYGVEYIDDDRYAVFDRLPNEKPQAKPREEHHFRLVHINKDNIYGLVYLVCDFRKYLASLKGRKSSYDVDDALAELRYYVEREYPIFAVTDNGRFVAYAVCRVDDETVWLEAIFVRKDYRRRGLGKILLNKAEEVVKERHGDDLYHYVHPNNDLMIDFLNSCGYDVLNLIEIRKAYPGEEPEHSYTIGDHSYRY